MERTTTDLDQGWENMQRGITKLKRILEGLPEPPFSSEESMLLYTYPLYWIQLLLLKQLFLVVYFLYCILS